jgi:hypothetical protein
MQAVKAGRTTLPQMSKNRLFLIAILLVIFILAALYMYRTTRASQAVSSSPARVTISQAALEEKYGLRVNLLAVTAAGGMVDLRLKMLDGEKAKLLLGDKENFPALLVINKNITLNAPEDTKSQAIKFEKDSGLYILFPNSSNAVEPGSPASIVFGDLQVEPVTVK